jgi:hypothetical protein
MLTRYVTSYKRRHIGSIIIENWMKECMTKQLTSTCERMKPSQAI